MCCVNRAMYNACRVKHALLSNKCADYSLIILIEILIELCIKNNTRSKLLNISRREIDIF